MVHVFVIPAIFSTTRPDHDRSGWYHRGRNIEHVIFDVGVRGVARRRSQVHFGGLFPIGSAVGGFANRNPAERGDPRANRGVRPPLEGSWAGRENSSHDKIFGSIGVGLPGHYLNFVDLTGHYSNSVLERKTEEIQKKTEELERLLRRTI